MIESIYSQEQNQRIEAGISRGKYRFRLQGVIREREKTADEATKERDEKFLRV